MAVAEAWEGEHDRGRRIMSSEEELYYWYDCLEVCCSDTEAQVAILHDEGCTDIQGADGRREWDGIGREGMEWNGMGRNGIRLSG